ncbi:hypothetical protein [Limosilactobacillus sp.]|uniref:hypothetical protein n=1 Tax=Limosilactobacillus sp. TaxID=2773925 RepID=UPI00359FF10F
MDENLKSTIASTKAIIRSTQGQLDQMKKDPHPDQKLMKVTQDNHDKAVQTLAILNKITGGATMDVGPRTVTDTRPINVDHNTDHGFQIIPPAAEDSVAPSSLSDSIVSAQSAQSGQQSAAIPANNEVMMTRAQYRAMLKKKKH